MKRPGPLLTLLAGLVLAALLLTLNATTGTKSASSSYQEQSPSPAPVSSPASPTPAPTPSLSVSPSVSRAADADYAGRTDDDAAAIAVSVRDGRAIAYFCDGRTQESWLKGDVKDDGTLRLTGKHGAKLEGTLENGKEIDGTVEVGGTRHAFTADRAKKPSGLWRATATVRSAKIDGGWIVLKDGSQVGVVTRDGEPSPAPRIDPATGAVTVDGQRLTARPATP
ncbi:hypothetical protein P1S61_10715 [Streptomyces sp. ME08-AFT2]|uniref:hypothetical protein n=1 Tax=Streptomyces sp. ME08-AFT2 TaxID=3028683 RepID=UPI0029A5CA9B|nr:hypothetical protein [Streptomyces sp. ME08-AFT2]MDX3309560.1 hypothetical protein [Streptomyces sp. ME08-AFT2]